LSAVAKRRWQRAFASGNGRRVRFLTLLSLSLFGALRPTAEESRQPPRPRAAVVACFEFVEDTGDKPGELVQGIGGITAVRGTIGSAVWASFVVDGDEVQKIDARELAIESHGRRERPIRTLCSCFERRLASPGQLLAPASRIIPPPSNMARSPPTTPLQTLCTA
jgi:hypothetical protein